MRKPTCVLQSPIWTRSGYGDWALCLAKSLLRYNKFELFLIPTPWGSCSARNINEDIQDPEGKELLTRNLKSPLTSQPDLFIQVTIPNEFSAPAKYNIGMTAGIESTVPRAEWIEGLNRMNLNIVTSKHSKDIFINTVYNKKLPNGIEEELKVEKPIEVLFWGADTKIYHKTDEKIETIEASMSKIKEDWCFLFVGQWTSGNIQGDRKAIGWLLKTFYQTFKDMDNPPALILKTSGAQICTMDRYECITKIHEVRDMVKTEFPNSRFPNAYLMYGELNDFEMNALYNHSKIKAHVSFTHGEGFGHPLLLATLSGKPVIAPNWSGHLDFLNPQYTTFFNGQLNPIPDSAVNEWFVKGSQWFDVNNDEAKILMKSLYKNYDETLLAKYEKLRLENLEKFSIQKMDEVFHNILDKCALQITTEEPLKLPPLKRIKKT